MGRRSQRDLVALFGEVCIMTGVRLGSMVFAALIGLAALGTPGVAGAASPYSAPNYVFPDGVTGFQLSTHKAAS
jgi:hypothetical protein